MSLTEKEYKIRVRYSNLIGGALLVFFFLLLSYAKVFENNYLLVVLSMFILVFGMWIFSLELVQILKERQERSVLKERWRELNKRKEYLEKKIKKNKRRRKRK